MSDALCLVVSPAAGRGRVARILPEVLGALSAGPVCVRACETASLNHAEELAAEACRQGESVVAVGGDGLVGSLAGAVAGAGGVLGIIPAGRGNDFARMLGIPAKPSDAAAVLMKGEQRAVDLIGVRTAAVPEQVVAGSVYLGVPSEGGEIASRSRLTMGALGYQVAGVRALLAWKPATFVVNTAVTDTGVTDTGVTDTGRAATGVTDTGMAATGSAAVGSADAGGAQVGGAQVGGAQARSGQAGAAAARAGAGSSESFPGFCVVVANSAYLAAGTIAAPAADVTDGLLDVITVRHGPKPSFVRVMLRAGHGTHVRLKQVGTATASAVTVTVDRAMPVGADGETLRYASPLAAGSPLHIRALPGALQVIAPAPAATLSPAVCRSPEAAGTQPPGAALGQC
jgi:diacylglycerol kinase family enzyme